MNRVMAMYKNKTIFAMIPARGGSKGIPYKNIKNLNGKPLIAYTLEEGLGRGYLDSVVVSTDDEKIAAVSKKYGAKVPFLRPAALAQDNTPGIDPVLHYIKWLSVHEACLPDYLCLLQCTSPLRKCEQINAAIAMLIDSGADSLVSVCESECSPYWMKKIEDGRMKDFIEPSFDYARRQDLPAVYRLNGAIYIAKTEVLLKNKNWYTDNTLAYVMDRLSSVDIDDMLDFKFAQWLMQENIAEK